MLLMHIRLRFYTDTSPIITLDDNDMTLGPPAGDVEKIVGYFLF